MRLRKIPLIFWLTILKNGLGEEEYKELGLPEPVGIRGHKRITYPKKIYRDSISTHKGNFEY